MIINIVISGREPREDETQHDGERDRQPPHLHEAHLTRKDERGMESLGRRAWRMMGGVAVDGLDRVEGSQEVVSKKDRNR